MKTGLTCTSSSAFVLKQIARGHYLVVKLWVIDDATGERCEKGFVIDEETSWNQTLPLSEYRLFLKTGDKAYLRENNVSPNSPAAVGLNHRDYRATCPWVDTR